MKRPFLTFYDYGQGGVWLFLLAESEEQIRERYPDLQIAEKPPPSLDEEQLADIRARTLDIDDETDPFLAAFGSVESAGSILGDADVGGLPLKMQVPRSKLVAQWKTRLFGCGNNLSNFALQQRPKNSPRFEQSSVLSSSRERFCCSMPITEEWTRPRRSCRCDC